MSTDLGEFLRARRARLQPDDVGLPTLGPRRVPGLRREEVALRAGISVDYLTRLEQGREKRPSPGVLDALARALDLDHDAAAHLFRLAGLAPAAPPAPAPVDRSLAYLLEEWPATPALVIDARLDVLAASTAARALFSDFARADNLVRMTFLDPAGRRFFVDWEQTAQACVANLRLALGTGSDDAGVDELVAQVHAASEPFRRMWARRDVQGKTHATKRFHHSGVGHLTLDYRSFDVRGAAGQQLITYHAAAGSPDADKLRLLGALAVTP